MLFGIISSIKGNYRLVAKGKFPERVLNIASANGIYIYDVKRHDDGTLLFSVSRKGAERLLSLEIEALTLSVAEKSGLPVFIKRYKKRVALIVLPAIFILFTAVSSLFIWKVEISGGDAALQSRVREVISENGVRTGALKKKVDHYEVKRIAIMEIDNLSWLWVDIKGTTASVKVRERTSTPSVIRINEPSDVISTHTGVIEKMQVYCGIPLFSEGMTVEKGQVIVTGVLRSENENIPTYYHHATANVILRLNEEKSFIIPKKSLIKTPTGNEKSIFAVNFKKNNIKFSLNSGISYTEYDKIEKTLKAPFLPVSFSKTVYREVTVTEEDTDISASLKAHRQNFENTLRGKDMEVIRIDETLEETDSAVKVTFNAECLVRADKEIPIEKGEQNGENY